MFKYEFVEVPIKGGLRAGRTDTFEECKKIIAEKAEEGYELVQIVPVGNEKTGIAALLNYTIVFKINK